MMIYSEYDLVTERRAQPWLRRADHLAEAFSATIHGEARPTDAMLVVLAAHVLWRESGGLPCWSQLDLDVLVRHLGPTTLWEIVGPDAPIAYHAFLTFLVREGHLSAAAALPAQLRLKPRFEARVEAIFQTPKSRWRRGWDALRGRPRAAS